MDDFEQILLVCEEFVDTCYEETEKNLAVFEKIKANYKAVQQMREQIQEQVKRDIEGIGFNA